MKRRSTFRLEINICPQCQAAVADMQLGSDITVYRCHRGHRWWRNKSGERFMVVSQPGGAE